MPPNLSRFRTYMIAGLSACGGAVIFYYGIRQYEKKQVYASWTTNYTPSEKWDRNWDRREPASLVRPSKGDGDDNRYNESIEKNKSKAVRHLFLIRHGQYNTSGKCDRDRCLTELGRQQAVMTGERLKQLAFPYTHLVRSTMMRANETAKLMEPYLPGVPIEDCSLIEEGAPVPPEPPVGHWRPENFQFFQDGPRIEAGFRKYFYRAELTQEKDSYEVIVCHANVIRYFICRALQFPAEGWLRLSLNHASITWVSILPSGRVLLRVMGESGHMPPDKITAS